MNAPFNTFLISLVPFRLLITRSRSRLILSPAHVSPASTNNDYQNDYKHSDKADEMYKLSGKIEVCTELRDYIQEFMSRFDEGEGR